MKNNLTLLSLVGLIILNIGTTLLKAQVVFDANLYALRPLPPLLRYRQATLLFLSIIKCFWLC